MCEQCVAEACGAFTDLTDQQLHQSNRKQGNCVSVLAASDRQGHVGDITNKTLNTEGVKGHSTKLGAEKNKSFQF